MYEKEVNIMRNNSKIWTLIMLMSLAVVVLVTFIICLAEINWAMEKILMTVDVVAAVVFTTCPVMITGTTETV